MLDSYSDYLNIKGVPLSDLGLKEMALSRTDAIHAISLLKEAGIPVLGGDVYFRFNSRIELAYANWYTNRRDGEDDEGYTERSLEETFSYISQFPSKTDHEPLFVFVLGEGGF